MNSIFRNLGIGMIAFIIGMNSYILYQVSKSKRMVFHKKVKSFQKMTLAIQWLYVNQIILFFLIAHEFLHHQVMRHLDWLILPLLFSYLLLDVYLLRNYILSALHGKLFEKDEIHKLNID